MRLGLPCHVHVAISGSLAIFLDTRRDRYAATPLEPRLMRTLGGEEEADDSDPVCQRLMRNDLLVPSGPDSRPFAPETIDVPQRSVLEMAGGRGALSVRTTGQAAFAIGRAHRSLRLGGLDGVATALRQHKAAGRAPAGFDRTVRLSRLFDGHRALIPAKRICLRDSVALIYFLATEDCIADIVFGVQAAPFHAHCWVQAGDRILNDSGYFPSSLTPILRI